MGKTAYPPWSAAEDEVIREVWREARFEKRRIAEERLPSRTGYAIQQRASFLGVSKRYAPRARKPSEPQPVPVARFEAVVNTPPRRPRVGACDRGDRELIRKRIDHVALALSGEILRPYHEIVAAIARLAAEGLKPDPELRMSPDD